MSILKEEHGLNNSSLETVNDQIRKRRKRISDVAGDGEKHSMIR